MQALHIRVIVNISIGTVMQEEDEEHDKTGEQKWRWFINKRSLLPGAQRKEEIYIQYSVDTLYPCHRVPVPPYVFLDHTAAGSLLH